VSDAPAVICAGRLYADLIFSGLSAIPALGTETFGDALAIHPGGGAVITAAHLAANGCKPRLMSTLPAAPFAAAITREIKAHGIDIALCKPASKGSDPQLTVAMSTATDRAFLTRRTGPAIPQPTLRRLKSAKATHLHIGELATLVEHPDLIPQARRAGLTVSLDCSWNEDLFRPNIANLIAAVDIFLPNAEEFAALRAAGLPLPMAPITVVKNGAKGAEMFRGNEHRSVPAVKTNVIDTTGAGDAFDGGFLAAWLRGNSPEQCLKAGAESGACAISGTGGFGGLT